MANGINVFCLKGIIKLIIVLAIILVLLVVGVSYLVNSVTLEKLGLADKKVFNGLTFENLNLADKSALNVYKEIKPIIRTKEFKSIYNELETEKAFEEKGINDALIAQSGKTDLSYLDSNILYFEETKQISLAEKEFVYVFRDCLSREEAFDAIVKPDTLIGVEIIKAGGNAFLRVVYDWSFYLDEMEFDIKFLKPKKLFYGFYFSLEIIDGKLNAIYKSSSINGVMGGMAEGIIDATIDSETFNNYKTIISNSFMRQINHLGKVGIFENQPSYGIVGIENKKINLITHTK